MNGAVARQNICGQLVQVRGNVILCCTLKPHRDWHHVAYFGNGVRYQWVAPVDRGHVHRKWIIGAVALAAVTLSVALCAMVWQLVTSTTRHVGTALSGHLRGPILVLALIGLLALAGSFHKDR